LFFYIYIYIYIYIQMKVKKISNYLKVKKFFTKFSYSDLENMKVISHP
jgi:hypothetical protein